MICQHGTWLTPGELSVATFISGEANFIAEKRWLDDKGWMFWSR